MSNVAHRPSLYHVTPNTSPFRHVRFALYMVQNSRDGQTWRALFKNKAEKQVVKSGMRHEELVTDQTLLESQQDAETEIFLKQSEVIRVSLFSSIFNLPLTLKPQVTTFKHSRYLWNMKKGKLIITCVGCDCSFSHISFNLTIFPFNPNSSSSNSWQDA